MKAIRMDIDLSSNGLGNCGSTPLNEGEGGGNGICSGESGVTRNGRPSSFGNVFTSKGGGPTEITATTTATTMAGDELLVRGFFIIISYKIRV
jgi:hypothetical protein